MVNDLDYEKSLTRRLLRFHSYLYWSQVFEAYPKSPYLIYWMNHDPEGYNKHVHIDEGRYCPFCDGWGEMDNLNTEVAGFPIFKVYCLCETLKILREGMTRGWESNFDPRARLSQILPIDVPPGAAKDTKVIVANCVNWLRKPTKWMLLTGGTGTAKTRILFALRRALGGFGYYITASDLVQNLGSAIKNNNTDELLYELIHAPFLLIDDFGMDHQGKGQYGINMISHVIDQRNLLGGRAPVVMATNLALGDFQKSEVDNVVRVGSRMMDSELSIVQIFTQADYRLETTKKAARLK